MISVKQVRLLLGLVAIALVSTAIACGQSEVIVEKEVITEVEVEVIKEVEVTKVVEIEKEVIVEKEVVVEVEVEVAAEGTYPLAGSTAVIAVGDVGPPAYHTPLATHPYHTYLIHLGIGETLLDFSGSGSLSSMIASDWTVDEGGITWTISDGIPWDNTKYGTVGVDDVKWSYDQGIREDAIGGWAGELYDPIFTNVHVQDDGGLRWDWRDGPQIAWSWSPRHHWAGLPIMSQAHYDDVGGDVGAQAFAVGSGPYKLIEHVSDDKIILEGQKNHYRVAPGFEKLILVEVEEAATRIAMLNAADADLSLVGLPLLDQIDDIPNLAYNYGPLSLGTGVSVYFGGNWRIETDEDGNTMPEWPPPSHLPWVGDYFDAESRENGRKVRVAMSMAIDRETINEEILGGQGCLVYIAVLSTCDSHFEEQWVTPYDPEGAKALLAEAGYADGFEVPLWISGGLNDTYEEISQAVAGYWENIGLTVVIDNALYQVRRPQLCCERSMNDLFTSSYGTASLADAWMDVLCCMSTRISWSLGFSFPEMYDIEDRLKFESDPDAAWAGPLRDYFVYQDYEKLSVGVVVFDDPWVSGNRLGSANMVIQGTIIPEVESLMPAQ